MRLRGNLTDQQPEASSERLRLSSIPSDVRVLPFLVAERCYPKEVQELYDVMRRFARVAGPLEHDKFIESHACQYVVGVARKLLLSPFVRLKTSCG